MLRDAMLPNHLPDPLRDVCARGPLRCANVQAGCSRLDEVSKPAGAGLPIPISEPVFAPPRTPTKWAVATCN